MRVRKDQKLMAFNQNRRQKKSSHDGFSLVELLLVMAIAGVLLSVLTFGYSRFLKTNAVETAAKDVSSTLDLARQMSIAVNSTHRVTFQLNDPQLEGRQAYWIDRKISDDLWEREVTLIHFIPNQAKIMDISSNDSTFEYIEFYPTGSSQAKLIHIINRADASTDSTNFYTVQVYESTGKAKIWEYTYK